MNRGIMNSYTEEVTKRVRKRGRPKKTDVLSSNKHPNLKECSVYSGNLANIPVVLAGLIKPCFVVLKRLSKEDLQKFGGKESDWDRLNEPHQTPTQYKEWIDFAKLAGLREEKMVDFIDFWSEDFYDPSDEDEDVSDEPSHAGQRRKKSAKKDDLDWTPEMEYMTATQRSMRMKKRKYPRINTGKKVRMTNSDMNYDNNKSLEDSTITYNPTCIAVCGTPKHSVLNEEARPGGLSSTLFSNDVPFKGLFLMEDDSTENEKHGTQQNITETGKVNEDSHPIKITDSLTSYLQRDKNEVIPVRSYEREKQKSRKKVCEWCQITFTSRNQDDTLCRACKGVARISVEQNPGSRKSDRLGRGSSGSDNTVKGKKVKGLLNNVSGMHCLNKVTQSKYSASRNERLATNGVTFSSVPSMDQLSVKLATTSVQFPQPYQLGSSSATSYLNDNFINPKVASLCDVNVPTYSTETIVPRLSNSPNLLESLPNSNLQVNFTPPENSKLNMNVPHARGSAMVNSLTVEGGNERHWSLLSKEPDVFSSFSEKATANAVTHTSEVISKTKENSQYSNMIEQSEDSLHSCLTLGQWLEQNWKRTNIENVFSKPLYENTSSELDAACILSIVDLEQNPKGSLENYIKSYKTLYEDSEYKQKYLDIGNTLQSAKYLQSRHVSFAELSNFYLKQEKLLQTKSI